MPCYHPVTAFQPRLANENGKRPLIFNSMKARDHDQIEISCGQCVGCRLRRAGEWAVRCMHEASLYEDDNCFITLTIAPENMNEFHTLDHTVFQKFMKRLRKKYDGVHPIDEKYPIRFYMCGEYGENFGRPHYHACIFNFDFPDKYFWRLSNTGHPIWRSPSLEELWPFGLSEIGTVTFESAGYVARYIMKKITGDAADEHYEYVHPDTGEIIQRKPEYNCMSRRPGIGKAWFDLYGDETYRDDFVVVNGKKVKPPKYYDRQFELLYPVEMEEIKFDREKNALAHLDNNTPDRLKTREYVQLRKLDKLIRPLT
jgi:hypothetical protein